MKLRELRESAGIEGCRDLGPLRAGAHHLTARARAESEPERIDENRLPRSGLPGERGESGAELHVEPTNDHEVPDCEMNQHGAERRMAGGRG